MHQMCAAALAGDLPSAREIDERLRPLHEAMFLEANPIPVKWALHEMGLIPPGIRLPLTPLTEERRPALRAALRDAGIELG
jgi:4-hydroxy-tetrahydrodipicolinate synthase